MIFIPLYPGAPHVSTRYSAVAQMERSGIRNQYSQNFIQATRLRKVHSTSKKQGHEQEWKTYLATLRQANLRRPRLVQILDSLTGKLIVEF